MKFDPTFGWVFDPDSARFKEVNNRDFVHSLSPSKNALGYAASWFSATLSQPGLLFRMQRRFPVLIR